VALDRIWAGSMVLELAKAWMVGATVFRLGAIPPRCSEWPTKSRPEEER
jgi:hypothetical protein